MARAAVERLEQCGRAHVIGPIRQEILSCIPDQGKFDRIKGKMRSIPELLIIADDYERAAKYYNACRARGVTPSHHDVLIAAVAEREKASIYAIDRDFEHYARVIPVEFFNIASLRQRPHA